MIISAARRFIFVHIPKTGGTSMSLALEQRAARDDMMLGDTPKALKRRRKLSETTAHGRLWKHATLADIDGLVTAEQLDQMFCFTLVRNPWDRIVSYYHWLQDQSFDHAAVALAQSLTFEDFACHPRIMASFHANSARVYMTDARGQMRASAFVRLENLAEDLAPIEAHLGFSLEIGHQNRSDRSQDWRGYYS
ncbi:MAG: sulfotransferase family 2 domain-containing protein, partial [Paracoccaceae bacterium]